MNKKLLIGVVVVVVLLLAWAPWITREVATQRVAGAINPCSFSALPEGAVDVGGVALKTIFGYKLVYTSPVVCESSSNKFENATQFFISALGTVHPTKYLQETSAPENPSTGVQITP